MFGFGRLFAAPADGFAARASAAKGAGSRIDAIDFWRGFALLTIFIDHAPDNVLQDFTIRNIGFSDAAELFVFLSGVSVALAYGTRFFRGERAAAVKAVLRRAFTLYWVQMLISLLIIALFAGAADYFDNDDLIGDDDRSFILDQPLTAFPAMLALVHQLVVVNILPLYVVLLLLAPALFMLARRNDWLMLSASAALYAVARVFHVNLPSWPLEDSWFFNPLAWQLIFAIGLFVGRRARNGGIAYDRRLYAACLAVVVAAAIVATDGFGLAPGLSEALAPVLDHTKTGLGLARLVNFLALAYVVGHSGLTARIRLTPVFAPLALMGRYSLPVFATGSVLAALGEVIVETRAEAFSHRLALGGMIAVAGILVHYLVARLLEARRSAQPRPVLAVLQWSRAH